MDTVRSKRMKRTESQEPNDVSMKRHQSVPEPSKAVSSEEGTTDSWRTETQRIVSPPPSCVSMKSEQSMPEHLTFSSGPVPSDSNTEKKMANLSKEKLEIVFKEVEHRIISLVENELKMLKKLLSPDNPPYSEKVKEEEEDWHNCREGVLKIILHILKNMNQTDLANTLEIKLAPACHRELKSKLKDKYKRINEGISGHGQSALLNEIYTELFITDCGSGEVNQEHEALQIETAFRKRPTQEAAINCNDIFKVFPGQEKPIKTVLTKGVAGIGKTVSVQKFILDWSEGKVNQDVLFMFPLPFRELNLMKEKRLSLKNLLCDFFPEVRGLKERHYRQCKIIFIFDGLDECRLPLDFQNNENLVDIKEQTSVDVLLTNLIKGNLFPSAHLWITSRPAAASQIPPECVDRITEVRGFSDPLKEEYFRKKINDQDLATKIITHLRSSRSLYIMCHMPVFCWIAATVLERLFGDAKSEEIPKTLTQMFTHFLIFQIKHKNKKYHGKSDTDSGQTRESILSLGKLAFQQLVKGNLIFYEEDLRESGIDIREVSVYSGVCTEIFKEEYQLHLGRVFSFIHRSVQEYLAAVYAFVSFINKNILKETNIEQPTTDLFELLSKSSVTDFLNSAVDKALQSENGHLDLFLRFLLGLSVESNQTLLQGILTQPESIIYSKEDTIKYIKENIADESPEKSINLFYCLNELNDHSLVNEVQMFLKRRGTRQFQGTALSPAQWSALVFVLLNSEEELHIFDLSKYDPSEEGFLRLLPVVKASTKVVLAGCNLTTSFCEILSSVLQSANSPLMQLDLSNNDLQDLGVELLCTGLKSSHCKLQILRLAGCNLTAASCEKLTSILQSPNSHLNELDLCNNDLQDSGVQLLSDGFRNAQFKLKILRLALCNLGEKSCENLGLFLKLETSSLIELDLSNNDLKDSGMELLSFGLKSLHCKLEILRLSGCMVTEKGCFSLASAISLNPSHLKELDLTYNHPGDSGVKLLFDGLQNPHCKLSTFRIEDAGMIRIRPGLKKYACDLTLDPNTANTLVSLSEENRKLTRVEEQQPYPDHPDRFDYWKQVLSVKSLNKRCYWEAEWSGNAAIAVSYKSISRKGDIDDCRFGWNEKSWSLYYFNSSYSVCHNNIYTDISPPPSNCKRIGVYVDCPAGTLSFYSVSSDPHTLTHLHTFYTSFTEPLYAGFWVYSDSSVCVCEVK